MVALDGDHYVFPLKPTVLRQVITLVPQMRILIDTLFCFGRPSAPRWDWVQYIDTLLTCLQYFSILEERTSVSHCRAQTAVVSKKSTQYFSEHLSFFLSFRISEICVW